MKKKILAVLTLALAALVCAGPLTAADETVSPAKIRKDNAALIAKLLPPELPRTLNLAPEDALAVGFVNAEAITHGKLFPEIMKTIGMDWETLLAAAGGKKEDTDACSFFFVKLKTATAEAASPLPAMELSGAVVYKMGNVVREQFEKSADEVRNSMAGVKEGAGSDVKVEKLKVGDKDAFLVSMPSQNMTVLSIAVGKNVVQFRAFFNCQPVKELLPARGEITPLAKSLDLNSAFAAAVDGVQLRTLLGELQEDPSLNTIRFAAVSVTEEQKGLRLVLRIAASDADGVQLIQTQIQEALAGLKEDPTMGPIASKTEVKVVRTSVYVRSFIPSEFILQNLQLYGEMQKAGAEPEAKPAPAKKPAKAKSAKKPATK